MATPAAFPTRVPLALPVPSAFLASVDMVESLARLVLATLFNVVNVIAEAIAVSVTAMLVSSSVGSQRIFKASFLLFRPISISG